MPRTRHRTRPRVVGVAAGERSDREAVRVLPQRRPATGDSRSDIPLFEALPASLAPNADVAARSAATAALDTSDLRDVVPWLTAWERDLAHSGSPGARGARARRAAVPSSGVRTPQVLSLTC